MRYTWGSPPTTYNYTGQRLDGTGLLYYGARYYHPRIGRFTQADTLVPQPGNPQSLNRYAYTLNNPLKYTDPTGHYIYEGGYNDDYDPTHHSYTLPNTAGLLGAEVWFLGPEAAAAIYGVATPMRVAMWSVVAVSDQRGRWSIRAAWQRQLHLLQRCPGVRGRAVSVALWLRKALAPTPGRLELGELQDQEQASQAKQQDQNSGIKPQLSRVRRSTKGMI